MWLISGRLPGSLSLDSPQLARYHRAPRGECRDVDLRHMHHSQVIESQPEYMRCREMRYIMG
jgi:hypothetical protein